VYEFVDLHYDQVARRRAVAGSSAGFRASRYRRKTVTVQLSRRPSNTLVSLVSALFLAISAASLGAEPWKWTTPGGSQWSMYQYYDLGSSTTPERQAFTGITSFPLPYDSSDVVEAGWLRLDASQTEPAYCFEISTQSPAEYPNWPMDTRIWYAGVDGTLTSLNDDFNGLFSKARVYLRPKITVPSLALGYAWVDLYIAAFSSNWNDGQFGVLVEKKNLSESDCTSGQTAIPWVKVIAVTPTVNDPRSMRVTFSTNVS
jgi:hypothetical protein